MDDERILIIDGATRERLKKFIAETEKQLHAEKMILRKQGFTARYQDQPISVCPVNLVGSPNVHWLEGYSSTEAPYRQIITGGGGAFNMTPAEHVAAFTDWAYSIGLPHDVAAKLVLGVRSGYRPDVLPTVQ